MSDFETAHQLEKAKVYKGLIPPKLAFEEVMKNRTLPPCSLNDFMDYLYYIEHNAESLQFFLWYCDYIQRWSQLLPRQKALSPVWDPEKAKEPRSRFVTYSHKRARSEKMNKILSIMDMDLKKDGAEDDKERQSTQSAPATMSRNFSRPRNASTSSISTMTTVRSPTESSPDWQPFTIQPSRDEMTKIVRQYIAEGAPRQLNLAPKDREYCLQATQHTTHPSALLPAFVVADANLRGQSHPNFIRWSMANVNRARMLFLQSIGVLLILLGVGLDVFFILSGLSHYLRIICLLLWWPGITVLAAALKGLCLLLHFHNLRHARPWEQSSGQGSQDAKSVETDSDGSEKDAAAHTPHKHDGKDTTGGHVNAVDPLRKPSLQTFGPSNDFSKEPWVAMYMNKSFLEKVFEPTVLVQNSSLQLLQDRSVFFAVLWGGLGASVLTVGSLFVPSGNLFL
ncbi:hypothetical protein GQ53DRAFT_843706 [Thozetella sp. PMI_491]|nr:hypothetical protein GQ53DRAFT_843706 [Thozetella sp. PMI_491]